MGKTKAKQNPSRLVTMSDIAPSDLEKGDVVWCHRIASHELKFVEWCDPDPEAVDPSCRLLEQEWGTVEGRNGKTARGITHQQFRHARFSELEFRPRNATPGGAVARATQGLATVLCECGCGEATSGRLFRQGHDARLKAALRFIAQGRESTKACYLHWKDQLTPEQAQIELDRRGW